MGPLASSVADVAELMPVLAGPDPGDPDSAAGPPVTASAQTPLRIGWIEFPRTSAEVRRVSERVLPVLTRQGHRVEDLEVPFPDPYEPLVDILAAGEAAATAPADEPWCDPGRIAVARYGRTVSGASVMRAEEARLALRTRLRTVMDRFDLLAMATVPIEPFGAREIGPDWAASPQDLQWLAWTPATYPFNVTGQPALSLPVGRSSAGLPVGLQLVGPCGGDELLLAAASRIEADLGLQMTPPQPETKGG
jgi:aspartyl-tRNA(Asn)/glutamyl-tRNA(Gln) amidotransferase subunit A